MALDDLPSDDATFESLVRSSDRDGGRARSRGERPIKVHLERAYDGAAPQASDTNYLIKGVMGRGYQGTLVGASRVGKTSLALDMAFAIALGADRYQGRRVHRAPVLYVGYEGEALLANRLSAGFRHYGDPGPFLQRLAAPELLSKGAEGERGVEQVTAAACQMSRECSQPVGLIIIDTKARATAGDDEDSNSDAAAYVEHRVRRIREATGAAVMNVHHTGKDAERGGRGASALPAADDFRIAVDMHRNVVLDKVRDGPDGPWFAYDLEEIELRIDADGDPVTACVIRTKSAGVQMGNRHSMAPSAQKALVVLNDLLAGGAACSVQPPGLGGADVALAVPINVWRDACRKRRLSSGANSDSESKAFRRAHERLEEDGHISTYGDFVWPRAQADRPGQQPDTSGRGGRQ